MKRKFMYLSICFLMLFLVGCGNMMNTPTKKVEEFLSKYQTMDSKVLKQLDDVLEGEDSFNDEQRGKYRDLMKNQYQNISYKIKDEKIDGDLATVTTEIEVYDYSKAIEESEKYLEKNKDDFYKDDVLDEVKYMDYKINAMKEIKDKVTYTIDFKLTKKDDEWKMNDISEVDRQKIHGIYKR